MRGREFPKRHPGQRWVVYSMESSVNYPALADPAFMSQFDITMGYWRTATVWAPYFGSGTAKLLRSAPAENRKSCRWRIFSRAVWIRAAALGMSARS